MSRTNSLQITLLRGVRNNVPGVSIINNFKFRNYLQQEMQAELKSRDEKPTVLSLPYIQLQQTVFIQFRCINARVILSALQYFASDNHPQN